ncbi:hypothetical protein [Palaeococcus ferrophilus]|uniref:hypothetical protein n=1 Tax=Palaeococcus ferrophilus TaxID=83868 RepID=UPI00064F8F0A|nr:hypothetical protein [Palaeococcus ferrophilus]
MVGDTVVQLSLGQLIGIIVSTIGVVLVPLLVFLWRVVESRNQQLYGDLREIRGDIKDIRKTMSDVSERITRVESRLDSLPTEFNRNLVEFENALLKQMIGGESR